MKTPLRVMHLRYLVVASAVTVMLIMTVILKNNTLPPVYAQPAVVDFEELAPDTRYQVGQGLISGGLPFCVESFTWGSGTQFSDGFVEISMRGMAGTGSQELWTNNANLRFGVGGVIYQLDLDYGAHGGNINIEINGERRFDLGRPSEIDGQEIGGVLVSVQEGSDGFGHLTLTGQIEAFAIGGQEFAIDNIQLEGDYFPVDLCEGSAFRLLLVTQNNRVAEYNVSIQPGVARGRPNQLNQWLVVALDQQQRPLDAYGIWDPRLTLVHDFEEIHSALEFDSQTAYLFDIVIPFTQDYNGGLAVEALVYDQELRLLADVDLTPAILAYCEERGISDGTCQRITLENGGIAINPISNLPGADFDERPEATIEEGILMDSQQVANCLPSEPLSPDELNRLLTSCGLR